MNTFKYTILLFLIATSYASAYSQGSVGIKPNPVILHDTKFMYDDFVFRNIDTALFDFHRYNPVMRSAYPAINLGNPGQKYHAIFYRPKYGSGFQDGQHLFDLYFRDVEQTRYFDTKTPFTDLTLSVGQKEEISIRGVHSQNINSQFNFGMDYERNASAGAYTRSRGIVQSLIMHSWYHTKNNAYQLMPSFSLNKAVIEENGGLAEANIFTSGTTGNRTRETIAINLNNAQNTRATKTLKLHQFIIPSLIGKKVDSSFVDSSGLAEKLRVGFTTRLRKNNFSYTDDQSTTAYYNNFYYNSNETIDSFNLRQFEQEVSIHNQFKIGQYKQQFSAAFIYQLTNYKQYELNRNMHDAAISATWHFNPEYKQRISNKFSAKVHLSPEYLGDFDIENTLRFQINSMMSLQWIAHFNNRSPSIKEQVWRSNHFYYYNYFQKEKIITNSLLFHCSHGHINGELTHHLVKNFI